MQRSDLLVPRWPLLVRRREAVESGTDYFKSGALVFDDPTSEFVFGTPSGWDPTTARATAAFPEACDRTKAGVSIVLGPTTSIQQVRGMVAMCGTRQGGVDLPMIAQQGPATLPDESWAGVPTAVTAAYNTVPTPDAVKASVAVAGGQPDGYPTLGRRYQGTESTRASSTVSGLYGGFGYRLAGLRDDGSRPSSRVISKTSGGSAKVKLIGSSSNVGDWQWDPANVGANRLIARVVTAESPPRECYAVRNGALPNVVGTVEIDLLSDPVCAQIITSAQVLESATVEVTIIFNANLCVWFCQQNASYSLDYAWVETHTGSGPSPNPPPMNLNIDPLTSRSFNAYGNLQVPRTQIDVKWHGLNAPLYEVPVFVGEVTARALASSTEVGIRHIGPLASKLLVPSSRSVVLRAVVDGLLVATARIDIADLSANGTTLDPANHLNISDWRYCNKPKDSTTC